MLSSKVHRLQQLLLKPTPVFRRFASYRVQSCRATMWMNFGFNGPKITDADWEHSFKAAALVASGDGDFHPEEKRFLVGRMVAYGVPQHVIDKVTSFDGINTSAAKLLAKHAGSSPLQKFMIGNLMIYEGLAAAMGDGILLEEEVQTAKEIAETLGVDDKQVDELEKFVRKEWELRKKREVIMYSSKYMPTYVAST